MFNTGTDTIYRQRPASAGDIGARTSSQWAEEERERASACETERAGVIERQTDRRCVCVCVGGGGAAVGER